MCGAPSSVFVPLAKVSIAAICSLRVAEAAQRRLDRLVDDLEVAAAGELLELHEREVGLDAGRVAIHHEADRAGRRDDGDLRVAVARDLADRERVVPHDAREGPRLLREERRGMRHRRDASGLRIRSSATA